MSKMWCPNCHEWTEHDTGGCLRCRPVVYVSTSDRTEFIDPCGPPRPCPDCPLKEAPNE